MKFVLRSFSLIIGAIGLLVAIVHYKNRLSIIGDKVYQNMVTELVTTTFDYPNPYQQPHFYFHRRQPIVTLKMGEF